MRNKELTQDILEKLGEKENSNSKIEKNIENLMKNTNEKELILYLKKLKFIKLLQIKSNLENYKVIIPNFLFILSMGFGLIPLILNYTALKDSLIAAFLFVIFTILGISYLMRKVINKSVTDNITSFNNNYKIVLYLVNFILENKKEEEFKNNLKEDSNENTVEVKSKVNKNKKKQKRKK